MRPDFAFGWSGGGLRGRGSLPVLAVVALVLAGVVSCGESASPVGKWIEYEASKRGGYEWVKEYGGRNGVEFFEDETCVLIDDDDHIPCTWKLLEDRRVKILAGSSFGQAMLFARVKGDHLTLESPEGKTGTAVRANSEEDVRLKKASLAGRLNDEGAELANKREYQKARKKYEEAAEMGNTLALKNLAVLYQNGYGVEEDMEQAIDLYRSAFEGGLLSAADSIASIYAHYAPHGSLDRDFREAVRWYKRAADADYLPASNQLAWLYATCPDPRFRDGEKALQYAERVVEEASASGTYQDTLAAAYARAGKFDQAVETQKRALELFRSEGLHQKNKKAYDGAQLRLEAYNREEAWVDNGGEEGEG